MALCLVFRFSVFCIVKEEHQIGWILLVLLKELRSRLILYCVAVPVQTYISSSTLTQLV